MIRIISAFALPFACCSSFSVLGQMQCNRGFAAYWLEFLRSGAAVIWFLQIWVPIWSYEVMDFNSCQMFDGWIGFPWFPYLLCVTALGWHYTWTLGCWLLWWVNRRIEALSAANCLESDTMSSIVFNLSSMVFNRSLSGVVFIVQSGPIFLHWFVSSGPCHFPAVALLPHQARCSARLWV